MSADQSDGVTVLIIHGVDTIRNSLERMLTSRGLPVCTYATPADVRGELRDAKGCLLLDEAFASHDHFASLAAASFSIPVVLILAGEARSRVCVGRDVVGSLALPLVETQVLEAVANALAEDAGRRLQLSMLEEARVSFAQLDAEERALLTRLINGGGTEQPVAVSQIAVHRGLLRKLNAGSTSELFRKLELLKEFLWADRGAPI
ncbi:hypothetical protein [Rhizobium mesosinicum]|uniref:Uncharacterized protein n=1 Tax=Rhizobium mesosinicum TaxID=335017 RepID=A0ABS7GP41_9HYPH|nr:hypothetical protein [Rhizobium mesosinicum]MBW9051103.1 hypothetical protein [Rhizobium mesosinicum]